MEKKDKTRQTIKKKSTAREYAEAIVIAIILALFIRTFIIQAFKIPSGSMKKTLLIGDHLLVNKFIYGIRIPFIDKYIVRFEKVHRGDVVVFKWPKDESLDFIKRVIGIAGDKIQIKDNVLYINDKKIKTKLVGKYSGKTVFPADVYEETIGKNKHYILHQIGADENFGPKIVPKNSIFVMGDNRDNSDDSRMWGFVKVNKILGKAWIIYFSWPHWKDIGKIIR